MIYSTFLDISLIFIFVFWIDYEPLEGKNQVLFILFHIFALAQIKASISIQTLCFIIDYKW